MFLWYIVVQLSSQGDGIGFLSFCLPDLERCCLAYTWFLLSQHQRCCLAGGCQSLSEHNKNNKNSNNNNNNNTPLVFLLVFCRGGRPMRVRTLMGVLGVLVPRTSVRGLVESTTTDCVADTFGHIFFVHLSTVVVLTFGLRL